MTQKSFWCLEAVFQNLRGIEKISSGYMGGHSDQPTYRDVCAGKTGHAEVVEIHFNPSELSLDSLLDVFFSIHDPTTLNRQGNDIGTQYRSAIYFYTEAQQRSAKNKIQTLAKQYANPIVTEVSPATTFWPAENEHHRYYQTHPQQAYCAFVIAPKIQKAMQHFTHLMRG